MYVKKKTDPDATLLLHHPSLKDAEEMHVVSTLFFILVKYSP